MAKTRWLFSCEAMHPTNHSEIWEVGAQEAKLRLLAKSGHGHKLARLALVKLVVADPVMIFGGWDRPEKDSCYVYAGTPKVDVIGGNIEVPAPPGMFFLAFIHPDGTIDDWVWRPTSELDPSGPDGINGEVLWPKQTT